MNIGNVKLDGIAFLAPMAGYTDLPFRIVCKEKKVSMVYTEMINAKALCYDDEKTKSMIKLDDNEHPVALQIFGHEPDKLEEATKILNNHNNAILDINMGCPAPKIVKNHEGSALMKNPKLIEEILKRVVKASKKPVTVKIRKGWDENSVNAVEIAKIAEFAGVDAIAVHGRTREQYYSGKADWDIIRKVKESVNIPVIGNGDIFDAKDAISMMNQTNCDAVMIGRGSQGNPWIFEQLYDYQNGLEIKIPTLKERCDIALWHLDLAIKIKGEFYGVREMRKHMACYVKVFLVARR